MAALAIVAGLALLAWAPNRFVEGAAGLADRWGLSRVLIGAVVIGFGTSMPEILVSGLAAAAGEQAVGVGNIVGSNVANLCLVVPIAALMTPLAVPRGLLRFELPLVATATVGFAVAVQGGLTRADGGLLLLGLVAAQVVIVRRETRTRRTGTRVGTAAGGRTTEGATTTSVGGDAVLAVEVGDYFAGERAESTRRLAGTVVLGLLATLAGAHLLVTGAVDVAARLGLSDGFVGLTIVAIGTSLPEMVTAAAAARSGEGDLILGNVIGSNLFNALGVGAVVGLVGPGSLDDTQLTTGAVALLVAVTAGATAIMARGRTVSRGEAIVLLVTYLVTLPLLAS